MRRYKLIQISHLGKYFQTAVRLSCFVGQYFCTLCYKLTDISYIFYIFFPRAIRFLQQSLICLYIKGFSVVCVYPLARLGGSCFAPSARIEKLFGLCKKRGYANQSRLNIYVTLCLGLNPLRTRNQEKNSILLILVSTSAKMV